jgi:hypothetical protein
MRRRSQARASGRSAGLSARPDATASSGNVFRDLGLSREEAAHLRIQLMPVVALVAICVAALPAQITDVTKPPPILNSAGQFSAAQLSGPPPIGREWIAANVRTTSSRGVQELAGHQDLGTTQRYTHLSPAALDAAIRLLDEPSPPKGGHYDRTRGEMLEAAGNQH